MPPEERLRLRTIVSKGLFPAILLVSAAVRWFQLGAQSLWFDETYTAYVAGQPTSRMMDFLISDGVHPPLYYWLMSVWIRIFGAGEWILRFPSAFCGVLSVFCLFFLVRKIAGRSEALLAAFLMAISPFAVWYSQDARMYSMVCLAAVAAVHFFWSFLDKASIGNVGGLILSHAALFFLQYFGLFLLLAEFCFLVLFWRKHGGRSIVFILAQIPAVLPLILWGQVLLQRENGSFGIGWIPKPNGLDLLSTVSNFYFANGGIWDVRSVAGVCVVILLSGLAIRRRDARETVWFGIFWFFLPILTCWAVSQTLPVYIDRYMIVILPASILMISLGANSLHGKVKYVLPGLLVILMVPGLWNLNVPTAMYRKEEWRQAADYLRAEVQPGDPLILRVFQEVVPLQYYGALNRNWAVIETNRAVALPDVPDSAGRRYLVYWLPSQSAHTFGTAAPDAFSESDPLVKDWVDHRLGGEKKEMRFNGVLVIVAQPAQETPGTGHPE
jgi:mannosyltransferase